MTCAWVGPPPSPVLLVACWWHYIYIVDSTRQQGAKVLLAPNLVTYKSPASLNDGRTPIAIAVQHQQCWPLPCRMCCAAYCQPPLCRAVLCWLQISGGDWKQELLFTVPRDHPEVERLEGRYKK
jgi:hypothetical protein